MSDSIPGLRTVVRSVDSQILFVLLVSRYFQSVYDDNRPQEPDAVTSNPHFCVVALLLLNIVGFVAVVVVAVVVVVVVVVVVAESDKDDVRTLVVSRELDSGQERLER